MAITRKPRQCQSQVCRAWLGVQALEGPPRKGCPHWGRGAAACGEHASTLRCEDACQCPGERSAELETPRFTLASLPVPFSNSSVFFLSHVWWLTPVITALGRLMQEDRCVFQASLESSETLSQKTAAELLCFLFVPVAVSWGWVSAAVFSTVSLVAEGGGWRS